MEKQKLKINAEWTPDCQGKQDYDGSILSLSTRFYPQNYQSNRKFSANSSLHLNIGGYPEYIELSRLECEGETEAEVKRKVEIWADEQFNKVVGILPKEFPTNKIGINFPRTFQCIAYTIIGLCVGIIVGIFITQIQ